MSYKRALIFSALLFCALPATANDDSSACQPRFGELGWRSVAAIHDGDSLKLNDGRKIRLLGINTPELARDRQPEQPFARQATDALSNLLPPDSQVGLLIGEQTHDRHGRTLAHIFLSDGRNISHLLLAQGLGSHIAIPPNLRFADCYHAAEQTARQQQSGIWSQPDEGITPIEQLMPDAGGFHIVSGKITRIGHSRHNVWLNMSEQLALRIPRLDMINFNAYKPQHLLHRKVEARGWIYHTKGQQRITLQHPYMIRVLP